MLDDARPAAVVLAAGLVPVVGALVDELGLSPVMVVVGDASPSRGTGFDVAVGTAPRELPAVDVPGRILFLKTIPLNDRGKVDRPVLENMLKQAKCIR